MNLPTTKARDYAPTVLRFGIATLFLWFGLSQITNPTAWVSWIPAWVLSVSWLSGTAIVLFNGAFETILGVLLIIGFYTRLIALLLSLHLFFIAYEVGYNDIGVRDFALAVSTIAISLFGPDQFSVDQKMEANAFTRNSLAQE